MSSAPEPQFSPLMRLLMDSVVADSAREMDGPHLVVCRDPQTGATSFQGPFPDGLSALVAADLEDPELEIQVAALLPPA